MNIRREYTQSDSIHKMAATRKRLTASVANYKEKFPLFSTVLHNIQLLVLLEIYQPIFMGNLPDVALKMPTTTI